MIPLTTCTPLKKILADSYKEAVNPKIVESANLLKYEKLKYFLAWKDSSAEDKKFYLNKYLEFLISTGLTREGFILASEQLEIDPGHHELILVIASIYIDQKKLDHAETLLKKYLVDHPKHKVALSLYVDLLRFKGLEEECKSFLLSHASFMQLPDISTLALLVIDLNSGGKFNLSLEICLALLFEEIQNTSAIDTLLPILSKEFQFHLPFLFFKGLYYQLNQDEKNAKETWELFLSIATERKPDYVYLRLTRYSSYFIHNNLDKIVISSSFELNSLFYEVCGRLKVNIFQFIISTHIQAQNSSGLWRVKSAYSGYLENRVRHKEVFPTIIQEIILGNSAYLKCEESKRVKNEHVIKILKEELYILYEIYVEFLMVEKCFSEAKINADFLKPSRHKSLLKAFINIELKDYDEAIKQFKNSLFYEFNNEAVLTQLLNVYVSSHRCDEAVQTCRELIKLNPYESEHYYHLALTCYKKILFLRLNPPVDPNAIKALVEEGLKASERCLELRPNYFEALHYQARLYYEHSDYQKSLEVLSLACENSSKADLLCKDFALTFRCLGNYELAAKALHKHLTLCGFENDKQSLEYLINDLLLLNRPSEAIKLMDHYEKIDSLPDGWICLKATKLTFADKPAESLSLFKRIKAGSPFHEEAKYFTRLINRISQPAFTKKINIIKQRADDLINKIDKTVCDHYMLSLLSRELPPSERPIKAKSTITSHKNYLSLSYLKRNNFLLNVRVLQFLDLIKQNRDEGVHCARLAYLLIQKISMRIFRCLSMPRLLQTKYPHLAAKFNDAITPIPLVHTTFKKPEEVTLGAMLSYQNELKAFEEKN